MKCPAPLASLFFLLFIAPAAADPSYVDLTDSPTITVDWSKGNSQAVTLHGNRAFTFSNGQKGGHYLLIIKQDTTGSRAVTWPPSVHWPGENSPPPPLTTTANKKDYISFFFDGTTYDLIAISQNF